MSGSQTVGNIDARGCVVRLDVPLAQWSVPHSRRAQSDLGSGRSSTELSGKVFSTLPRGLAAPPTQVDLAAVAS
eukprot:6382901-Amphidinium_carterae.1